MNSVRIRKVALGLLVFSMETLAEPFDPAVYESAFDWARSNVRVNFFSPPNESHARELAVRIASSPDPRQYLENFRRAFEFVVAASPRLLTPDNHALAVAVADRIAAHADPKQSFEAFRGTYELLYRELQSFPDTRSRHQAVRVGMLIADQPEPMEFYRSFRTTFEAISGTHRPSLWTIRNTRESVDLALMQAARRYQSCRLHYGTLIREITALGR